MIAGLTIVMAWVVCGNNTVFKKCKSALVVEQRSASRFENPVYDETQIHVDQAPDEVDAGNDDRYMDVPGPE